MTSATREAEARALELMVEETIKILGGDPRVDYLPDLARVAQEKLDALSLK